MATINKTTRTQLLKKHRILQQAAKVLKKEFIGLDNVIEEIIGSVSPWYFFPQLQENPVVVNLWGLTGVGKTSLINRLSELIHFEDKTYYFNFGEKFNYNIHDQIEDINKSVNASPVIMVFDEFQNARSLSGDGTEKEFPSGQMIWQLLDSGKFPTLNLTYYASMFNQLLIQLRFVVAQGVKAQNGVVVSGRDIYIKYFSHNRFYERPSDPKSWDQTQNIWFIPTEVHHILLDEAPEFFFPTYNVTEKLNQLNAKESIEFLECIHKHIIRPKTVDCSKAIIFNIGNLDEVYEMSSNFNPDISADEFHEQSLMINVPQIKNELRKRFRNEQIARLGNNHIIYPAFSSSSFRQIITMELNKIAAQMFKTQNIKLSFDKSIHELIYNEGVYPTQGTRPVFTTIHYTIKNNLAKILTEIHLHNIPASRVNFSFDGSHVYLSFFRNKKLLHILYDNQEFNLTKLRRNKSDDMQAIIAVHEAGHAVISAILLHTIPEQVFSTTASQDQSGFLYTKVKWDYISRKEILSRLALFLGGLIAEKLVFGEENITTGADDDIRRATFFVNAMLKEHGMGKRMIAINANTVSTRHFLNDFDHQIEQQAREWIDEATQLAEQTLKKQQTLLLRIAGYLSNHSSIKKEKLRDLIKSHAVDFPISQIIEDGSNLFYRRRLMEQIRSDAKPQSISNASCNLQLNHNHNKSNP
jgi:cell division protease FtsH